MSKVIDMLPRLKTNQTESSVDRLKAPSVVGGNHAAPVINLDEKKQTILFQERRQVKRTILSEFVSSMVIVPEKGLLKISLYDVSEDGLSFDLESKEGQFKVGEEISLRVYMNQKTYFPVVVTVKHMTTYEDEGVTRHGVEYVKTASVNGALQHFVKFLEAATTSLKSDNGDFMINHSS